MYTGMRSGVLGIAFVLIFNSAYGETCRKYDEKEIRANINAYLSIVLGKSAPSLYDFYRYHSERDSSELDAELLECSRLFGHAPESQDNQRAITKRCDEWMSARRVKPDNTPSMYFTLLRRKLLREGVAWKLVRLHLAKEVQTTGNIITVALLYPDGTKTILELSHRHNECEFYPGFIQILSIEGKHPHTYLGLQNQNK